MRKSKILYLIIAALIFGCEGHASADWASFRKDPLNGGVQKIDLEKTQGGGGIFSFKTNGIIWASPVIDKNGNVYFGSADKYFYALNPKGKLIWKYRINDVPDSLIDSAAVITSDNKKIIVPGGDGYLHALDIGTGEKIWDFKAYHASAEQAESGELVNSFEGNVVEGPNGNIYAGSDNGTLYCVSQDGQELWDFKTGMMVWSAPVFSQSGGWLSFGSLDGRLYLLDSKTGKLLDKIRVGEIKASPSYDPEKNLLFLGSSDGVMQAFQIVNRRFRRKWQIKTGGEIYSSAAYYKNNIYFGSADGFFYSVGYNGKINWKYNAHSIILSSPAVIENEAVVFGAGNGKIYALDFEGSRIWSFKTAGPSCRTNLDSSPAVSQAGNIFVGSYNGNLYGLPRNYCLKNISDPNCEFGGKEDAPVRQNKILMAENNECGLSEKISVGLSEPIRIKLLNDKAINSSGLSVKISPDAKFEYYVSSDGRYLDIFPDKFWEENTSYKIEASGTYYTKTNYLLDRLKWFFLPKFSETLEFDTAGAGQQNFPVDDEFGIENMFFSQPQELNSLVAAALDGQKYALKFSNENGKTKINVSAGQNNYRKMSFDAELKGNYFTAKADNKTLSAMGGTIPCKKIIISGEISGGEIKGAIFAVVNGLKLKGNLTKYQLPWNLCDKICDWKFDVTIYLTTQPL